MATFEKRASGWRAQINVKGARASKVFPTKAQAAAWAAQKETEIRLQLETGIVRGRTLRDACSRYEKEVSPHKRGHAWEIKRMNFMCDYLLDGKPLGARELVQLTPDVLGRFRARNQLAIKIKQRLC